MRRKWLASLLLLVVLLLAMSGVVQAQNQQLYWQRYDVDLAPQQNGDLRVEETQELVFTDGVFRYGQRAIELKDLAGIEDVTVREEGGPVYTLSDSGEPYTYSVRQDGNYVNIRYNFPPTSDSRRTIVIDYTAKQPLRYYPENGVDQLYWVAIPAGNPFPTRSSVITLHAPEGTGFTNAGIHGADASSDFQKGQRDVTINVKGPIQAGQMVEVVAEWPHGYVAGQAQPWQRTLDAQAAQQVKDQQFRSTWGSVFTLGFASLGVLIAVGGLVLLYLWWYRRGRDAPVGLVADYLPEPSSDLPAGVAGTLIDESADVQDVLASILDLARRGVLEIEESEEPGFMGIGAKNDFTYRKKDMSVPMRKFEKTLIDDLFDGEKEVRLSELRNRFYASIPELRSQLYDEVVKEGFFTESPEKTRNTFGCAGIAALVIAMVVGFFFVIAFSSLSGTAVCVPGGLLIVAVGLIVLARHMPRRTEKGADATARWLAFKRYLQNLEKYTKVEDATNIFEKYLPYAVAFGLEQSWIRKFSEVNTPAPTWWIPVPRPTYYGPTQPWGGPIGGRPPGHAAPVPSESGGSMPSLEGMSKGMGASLASMSAGLGGMLATAGNTLTSRPSSSGGGGMGRIGGFGGGGFSGGGGFGGGGSGGGGSSFG